MNKLNLLFSHHYLKGSKIFMELYLALAKHHCIMIDSGAYSAFNSGKVITLDEYMHYCKDYYHGYCWQYVQLDKIKTPIISFENLKKMHGAGLSPMPVFVHGYEWDVMKDLSEMNEYICVAGGVGSKDSYARYRYQKCFDVSGQKAKIHALGFLRFPDFFQLPIYSGDSSSHTAASRYGVVKFFDKRKGLVQIDIDTDKSIIARLTNYNYVKNKVHSRFTIEQVLTNQSAIEYQYTANRYDKKVFAAISNVTDLFSFLCTALYNEKGFVDYYKGLALFQKLNAMLKEKEFNGLITEFKNVFCN